MQTLAGGGCQLGLQRLVLSLCRPLYWRDLSSQANRCEGLFHIDYCCCSLARNGILVCMSVSACSLLPILVSASTDSRLAQREHYGYPYLIYANLSACGIRTENSWQIKHAELLRR